MEGTHRLTVGEFGPADGARAAVRHSTRASELARTAASLFEEKHRSLTVPDLRARERLYRAPFSPARTGGRTSYRPMARRHRPRRGSLAFSPRSRAVRPLPRVRSWAPGAKPVAIEGFAGFKVGMTHAFIVDYRKRSTTAGQEVSIPVTVVEVPPLRVVAARLYARHPYGSRIVSEVWASGLQDELTRRIPKHPSSPPRRSRPSARWTGTRSA